MDHPEMTSGCEFVHVSQCVCDARLITVHVLVFFNIVLKILRISMRTQLSNCAVQAVCHIARIGAQFFCFLPAADQET